MDAILIASSTNTHAALLSGAVKAHKPAYCEKPIDLNIERVKAVVQEASHATVPIMIGFSRCFDPNHLGVRETIEEGNIGKVEMMHLTSRGREPPPISYVKVSGDNCATRPSTGRKSNCWPNWAALNPIKAAHRAKSHCCADWVASWRCWPLKPCSRAMPLNTTDFPPKITALLHGWQPSGDL